MKKLMTIMFMLAMCGTAMAQYWNRKPYDLSMDTQNVVVGTETYREREKVNGKWTWVDKQRDIIETVKVATLHDYTNANGTTGLTYTVAYNNGDVNYQSPTANYFSHTYFTTKDLTLDEGEILAVQFMGAEISNHGGDMSKFDVLDYGIYLYDPATDTRIGDYMSIGKNNNYFDVGTNQSFGVYYVNKEGEYITSTDNFLANYDGDDHEINIYSETVNGETVEYPEGKTITTSKRYMCMLETEGMSHPHWEFMLQTTIDNPYYEVNPHEFEGNGSTEVPDTTSGQPLPGTMATLVVSGLCAVSLRKKNRK